MNDVIQKILSLINQIGPLSAVWITLKSGNCMRRIVLGINITNSKTVVQVMDPMTSTEELIPLEEITGLVNEV